MANDVLGKGVDLKLPSTSLPIQFRNPQLKIIEHGVHIALDFMVTPGFLGDSGAPASGGC
jgi:hypothetical protein